ncbi:Hint domain-containing protein [Yoonia sp. SS1-5]|uniref:Hint domain-containing protein n=1 Tax=Yoonia rhodophyticola TaxID=3137370 RepID=A0AAN0MI58_9RHOB
MADFLNGILISEILADNAGGAAVDVNGNGTTNKQDEFVEFQNNTNADIDLEGYAVWSQERGLLHEFIAGSTILAGQTAAVIGEYTGSRTDYFGASNNSSSGNAQGGFLEDGEGNKDDTIYLVAPNGDYIRLSYGQPPNVPTTLPTDFPTGGSLQGTGETINSGAPNGTSFVRDADGNFVEGTPTPGVPGTPCFTPGTMIATDQGDVPVAALRPGMRVKSRDNGYVPLRAIRAAEIARAVLQWHPDLRAVTIPAGALGNDRQMMLSPAHCVLVQGADVELICDAPEAFVPVHHFVGLAGIGRVPGNQPVTYCHLLFDRHEVICSDGAWTESLYMGDLAHAALRAVQEWETEEGRRPEDITHDARARTVLKAFEARVLLDRGLRCVKAADLAA